MKIKSASKPQHIRAASAGRHASGSIYGARETGGAVMIFLSALTGFLAAGTHLGGNGSPLCAAAAAVLPFSGGIASFAGALAAFFLNDTFIPNLTEIIAMPAAVFARAITESVSGKKPSPAAAGITAAAAYIAGGIAAAFSFRITAALVMAVVFRGTVCGCAAYFFASFLSCAERGLAFSDEAKISSAVVYALALCMLSGVKIGAFNAGRAAGAFVTLAAAFRYGSAGGAAAGALSAFAFGASSPQMASTSAVMICSGLASGIFYRKNKPAASAVFAFSALAGALVYGMPSDAPKLIADTTLAAAAFCLLSEILPEKFIRIPKSVIRPSAAMAECAGRLRLTAAVMADIRESYSKAADVLGREKRGSGISEAVLGKVCAGCRSSAFCGENEERRTEEFFRPAELLLRKKGAIAERELSRSLEHCARRDELAEAFNGAYRLERIEEKNRALSASMRELTSDRLSETEEMLLHMSSGFPSCDETLSEYALEALRKSGAKNASAAALYDSDGRIYIECFFDSSSQVAAEQLAKHLGRLADRELAPPETVSAGEITAMYFCEAPVFEAETGKASSVGKETTSGDSDTLFKDGFGNLWFALSDGMGSGVRAAVESSMTVSVLARAIRGGIGAEAALRLVNSLLVTKSPEEMFATADLLKINLFTGRAELFKLGSAQTFFKTNGTVKTAESRSAPMGIVFSPEAEKRSVQLGDGDMAVMMTDGIPEDCFARVRELMLSIGVTPQDCAERIIAEAEKGKEDDPSRRDDKTVFVLKLLKVGQP